MWRELSSLLLVVEGDKNFGGAADVLYMKMLSCGGFGFLGFGLVLWIADGLLCSVVCVTQNWPQP
jgi:hypothetical protein